MKKYVIALAFLNVFGLGFAEKTVKFDFQTSEARQLEVSPSTYVQPLVTKVVVDTKKGRIHDKWELTLADYQAREYPNDMDATLQNLRAYGLFKSSEKHNCDLIVAPTFDISISDRGVVINLIGYTANFSEWSTGTKADYEWIKLDKGMIDPSVDVKFSEDTPASTPAPAAPKKQTGKKR